jgi:hypothetical protein
MNGDGAVLGIFFSEHLRDAEEIIHFLEGKTWRGQVSKMYLVTLVKWNTHP